MYESIHVSVIGDSHIQRNIVCQDASGTCVTDDFAIAVVADGHGSSKHFRSDVGSKIAVRITIELLKNYMSMAEFREQFPENPAFIIEQMEKQILMKWREAVEEYHLENPLSEEEEKLLPPDHGHIKVSTLYGSTLLAAVMAKEYSFGLVLGDGGLVVMNDAKQFCIPVEDPNAHANYTSSLCNTGALNYFEDWYTTEPIKAMFVSTDGLFKSFASDEDFLRYHGLIVQMLSDKEKAEKSLERNFGKRTREGSGDDISMALVYEIEEKGGNDEEGSQRHIGEM